MGTGGKPPELDILSEFVGTSQSQTYRFRIELHWQLTAEQQAALRDRLTGANKVPGPGNYTRADAVSYLLGITTWDSHSEKLIKVAVNPEGFNVTAV